jgi:hypothetical protein
MKKLRLILSMVCLLVFGLIVNQADAQQTRGGTPPTFLVKEAQALPAQAYVKMPVNFSVSELLKQDELYEKRGFGPVHYAKIIYVDITMKNSGVWTELPDGKKIWRVAVEAKGAKALNFYYDDFYLPSGSQLFIYNADKTHVLGAYDNTSNSYGSYYSTDFVAGDIVIFEYVAPSVSTGDEPKITITKVGYGYNNIHIVPVNVEMPEYLAPGTSVACQVNVICSPEGDLWQTQSTSVCEMTLEVGGGYVGGCSGTLINNTENDGTPYIISAFHCTEGMTAAQLAQSSFHFFYEEHECTGRHNTSGYFTWMKTLVGAQQLVTIPMSGASDGALLKLNQPIPDSWLANCEIIFAGWDRRDAPSTTAQSGVAISHPRGDSKKIATFPNPASITGSINWCANDDCSATVTSGANAHWAATFVPTANGFGQSEGGSSGSGLLNQNGVLIGTLSGGGSVGCDQNSKTSFYGGLFYHWDKYGSMPETQMKTWLDPVGGGTAETCPPWPNCNVVDFSGYPREIYAIQSSKFTGIGVNNADSVKWEFEGGTPTVTNELHPLITYNTAGLFDVKLTAHFTDSQGQDSVVVVEKDDYITVTIKGGAGTVAPKADVAVVINELITPPLMQNINQSYTVANDNATGGTLNNARYLKYKLKDGILVDYGLQTPLSDNYRDMYTWVRTNTNFVDPFGDPTGLSGYGGSGYYYAYVWPDYETEVRMTNKTTGSNTLLLNLVGKTRALLKFKLFRMPYQDIDYPDMDGVRVEYRTSNSGTFQEIASIAPTSASTLNGEWKEYEFELPDLASATATYQIGITSVGNWGGGMALDDIEVWEFNYEELDNIIVWEGDGVEFTDLSTGPAVLYNYEFEGGYPETSTTDALKIGPVYYYEKGKYDIYQKVQNHLGTDEITKDDYVTVLSRILELDTTFVESDCNIAIDVTVNAATNRNIKVSTSTAWLTVIPSNGGNLSAPITQPDVTENIAIQIQADTNKSVEPRRGEIVVSTDDDYVVRNIIVEQKSVSPNAIAVIRQADNVSAEITWRHDPINDCDIIDIGGNAEANLDEWLVYRTTGSTAAPGWMIAAGDPNATGTSQLRPYAGKNYFISISDPGSISVPGYTSANRDADSYLITPKVKITSAKHTLSYWVKSYGSSYRDNYEVLLSTTTADPAGLTTVIRAMGKAPYLAIATNHGYTNFTIDLTAHIGQEVYIGFHHYDSYQYAIMLDDISGLQVVNCTPRTQSLVHDSEHSIKMLSFENAVIREKVLDEATQKRIELRRKMSDLRNSSNTVQNPTGSKRAKQSMKMPNSEIKSSVLPQAGTATPQAIDVSTLDQIRWCGDRYTSYRFNDNSLDFRIAAKWLAGEAKPYTGATLQAIEFVYRGNPAEIELFVIEGNDIIYTQPVTGLTEPSWDPIVVELNTPVTLSGNKDLYLGYLVKAGYEGYPMVFDAGPVVPGKGDLVSFPEEDENGIIKWESFGENYNLYIVGYATLAIKDGYKLFRMRTTGTDNEPVVLASGLTSKTYLNENIKPGGEYCYYVTYQKSAIESCPSDTGCVFIQYQQDVNKKVINKEYGDERPFDLELKNTAEDIDYFEGRLLPIELEIASGNSISLSGVPNDYSADILSAGITELKAVLPEIQDTLLSDTIYIQVNVRKHDLYVIGADKTKQQGTINPPLTLSYDDFVYGEQLSVLQTPPQASTSADIQSPIGEYKIAVTVSEDKNYNLIPVDGVLRVLKNEDRINAFTPYSIDNLNDRFMPGYKLKIFNRYGVLVYETDNVSQKVLGWDGTFKGTNKLVDPGVYYYVAYDEQTGKVTRTGSVNVVK